MILKVEEVLGNTRELRTNLKKLSYFLRALKGDGLTSLTFALASMIMDLSSGRDTQISKILKDVFELMEKKEVELIEDKNSLLQVLGICQSEAEKILSKYGVKFARELEDKIARGEVPEHPAWEELIELENLEARIKGMKERLGLL